MANTLRGEQIKSARLTDAVVLEMRALYGTGEWSVRMLAERFDCGSSAAFRVVTGRAWAHLPTGRVPSHEEVQARRTRRCWEARRRRSGRSVQPNVAGRVNVRE